MGVHDDRRLLENISPNDIGCFSPDAGKRDQFLNVSRNVPAVIAHQPVTTGDDVSRLAVIKAAGMNALLQFFQIRPRKSLCIRIFLKQSRRDQINPRIGTLGRQDGGDEQLQRIFMMQIAFRIRAILFVQPV